MKKLFFFLALASALSVGVAEERFSDWFAGLSDNGMPYIITINDSGHFFGKWCEDDGCYWVLGSDLKCESATTLPALLNSESGSYPITLTCSAPKTVGGKQYWRSIIHGPDVIDGIVRTDRRIGLAIAMKDGSFRVLRFSLEGSGLALRRWEGMLANVKPSRNTTKDVSL